jgi:hypothetical protein
MEKSGEKCTGGGGGVGKVDSALYSRARICKRLRSPGIDSKEAMPPAGRESIPGLLKGLQIRALIPP